jgi:alpha-tubulin suppressor-like RCC1 family protein
VSAAAGASHSLAVTDDGEAHAWGASDEGCLGLGPPTDDFVATEPVWTPRQVPVAGSVRMAQARARGDSRGMPR